MLVLGLPVLIAAAVHRFQRAPTPPPPSGRSIALRVIVLGDDDGSRRPALELHEIHQAVAFANEAFEPAGISFTFDPTRDLELMNDTLLNGMAGPQQKNWMTIKRAANEVAHEDEDRVTVFYRHGPKNKPASHSFAAAGYDFVGMPGFKSQVRCERVCTDALAHELGHYFGLRHTFRANRPKSIEEAESRVRKSKRGLEFFDGDGLADTAPDLAIPQQLCDPPASSELGGELYEPPIENLMSYYYGRRRSFTRQQIEILRWGFDYRREHGGRIAPTHLPDSPIEAETMRIVSGGCETSIENMNQFAKRRWSGGKQLRVDGGPDCSLVLELEVPETGAYDLELWATLMPRYGKLHLSIDGVPLGREIDLWAPIRMATGPISVGAVDLAAGRHRIRVSLSERNERATANMAGLDAFVLHRREDRLLLRLPARGGVQD